MIIKGFKNLYYQLYTGGFDITLQKTAITKKDILQQ